MKRPLIVAILIAIAAVPAAAQNKGKRGFVWDDRPTIVFGEDVNIAVTGWSSGAGSIPTSARSCSRCVPPVLASRAI